MTNIMSSKSTFDKHFLSSMFHIIRICNKSPYRLKYRRGNPILLKSAVITHKNTIYVSSWYMAVVTYPYYADTSQRTHDGIITSLLSQNDVATSFRRNNNVIITSCARWAMIWKSSLSHGHTFLYYCPFVWCGYTGRFPAVYCNH